MTAFEKIENEINAINNIMLLKKIELNSNYSINAISTIQLINNLYDERLKYKQRLTFLKRKKERINKLNNILNDRISS
jgi:hypothetical protein